MDNMQSAAMRSAIPRPVVVRFILNLATFTGIESMLKSDLTLPPPASSAICTCKQRVPLQRQNKMGQCSSVGKVFYLWSPKNSIYTLVDDWCTETKFVKCHACGVNTVPTYHLTPSCTTISTKLASHNLSCTSLSTGMFEGYNKGDFFVSSVLVRKRSEKKPYVPHLRIVCREGE